MRRYGSNSIAVIETLDSFDIDYSGRLVLGGTTRDYLATTAMMSWIRLTNNLQDDDIWFKVYIEDQHEHVTTGVLTNDGLKMVSIAFQQQVHHGGVPYTPSNIAALLAH